MEGFAYVLVILAVLAAVWPIYSRTPTARGRAGERRVRRVIGKTEEGVRIVLNDYRWSDGQKSAQIDHIVINRKSVFVLETKNYSGRIYGTDLQKEWTQVLRYGKVKNKFHNPVWQNATHVYRIQTILRSSESMQNIPITSVVVLVQNNTRYLQSTHAIPLSALRGILNQGEDHLDASAMKAVETQLLSHRSDISTKAHVQNI